MSRSLKQQYKTRRVQQLKENLSKVDSQLLQEQKTSQLIVEAMSDDDLKKVEAIVQKLSTLKTPELPKLKAAIEQAESELNKYTAGGPITAAWTKMKGLVGIDNPVVKITTFANALERGFSQIPTILKNNGVDLKSADLNKSLADVLGSTKKTGAMSDKDLGSSITSKDNVFKDDPIGSNWPGPNEAVQNEAEGPSTSIEGKLKNVVDQIKKALAPGGIFGVFKKVPYISSDELAQELVSSPLRVFSKISKRINSGAKAADVATDIKAVATGTGGAETKGTKTGAETKPEKQTQPGEPSKPTTVGTNTVATGSETPVPQGGGAAQNIAAAKQRVTKLILTLKKDPQNIDAVVKALVDAGLDASKLPA